MNLRRAGLGPLKALYSEDTDMGENQDTNIVRKVASQFGQTIRSHISRLTGRTVDNDVLKLDGFTLACVVLIAERETEIKKGTKSLHYTEATLMYELSTLGARPDRDPKGFLADMKRAGYIRVGEDGTIRAQDSLLDMSRLLERIFPKMPGMSLVAYIVQTMEEVLSGRKDLDAARGQLDQMLGMQGVPLHQPKKQADTGLSQAFAQKKPIVSSGQRPIRSEGLGEAEKQAILRRLRATATPRQDRSTIFGSPGILHGGTTSAIQAGGEKEGQDTRGKKTPDGSPTQDLSNDREETPEKQSFEEMPAHDLVRAGQEGEESLRHEEHATEVEAGHIGDRMIFEIPQIVPDSEAIESENLEPMAVPDEEDAWERDGLGRGGNILPAEKAEAPQQQHGGIGPARPEMKDAEDTEHHEGREKEDILKDDAIETRIAAFEEYLAMTCPLCGKGKIEEHVTAKGKRFYECTNEDCYFVSWGKPYHFPCPRCQNPFMIEAFDASGKAFLKCPRATCNFKQNLPGDDDPLKMDAPEIALSNAKPRKRPVRKVVRRRLVPRKR